MICGFCVADFNGCILFVYLDKLFLLIKDGAIY